MNYCLFKLQFETPCHFGASDSALSLYTSEEHFCADTLFSALCHTAKSLYGEAGVERLCKQAVRGELLLSDSMPWAGERYYLPKPYAVAKGSVHELSTQKRKAMKKLNWIAMDAFAEFTASLQGGQPFDAEREQTVFGVTDKVARVSVVRQGDSLPYSVGIYSFFQDCGLYFLAGFHNEEQVDWFSTLLNGLGLHGIGGKTSSGYGKFSVCDMLYLDVPIDSQTEWLATALTADSAHYLLLTTSLPSDGELENVLEGASFSLTRRSGFVQSTDFASEGRKKQVQYFLSAGSVLPCRFDGELYPVGQDGNHPVYRFSKPILLGVSL